MADRSPSNLARLHKEAMKDPKHHKVFMYHPTKDAQTFDATQLAGLDEFWRDTPYTDAERAALAKGKKLPKPAEVEVVEENDDLTGGDEPEKEVDESEKEADEEKPPRRLDFSSQAEFNKAKKAWDKAHR